MVEKIISDFKKSKYRNVIISLLVTLAFVAVIAIGVLIFSTIISLLLPYLGAPGTLVLLVFLFLWILVYKILEIDD